MDMRSADPPMKLTGFVNPSAARWAIARSSGEGSRPTISCTRSPYSGRFVPDPIPTSSTRPAARASGQRVKAAPMSAASAGPTASTPALSRRILFSSLKTERIQAKTRTENPPIPRHRHIRLHRAVLHSSPPAASRDVSLSILGLGQAPSPLPGAHAVMNGDGPGVGSNLYLN